MEGQGVNPTVKTSSKHSRIGPSRTMRTLTHMHTNTDTQSLHSPDSHRGRCTSCERLTVLEARSSAGTCQRLKIIIVSRLCFSLRKSTLSQPRGPFPLQYLVSFLPLCHHYNTMPLFILSVSSLCSASHLLSQVEE